MDNKNAMCHDSRKNIRLDYIMLGLPTGGKSESLHFIACPEVDYYLCLK